MTLLVQKVNAKTTTATAVATLNSVVAGNLLVLVVTYGNAEPATATSANVASSGDTWQTAIAPTNVGGFMGNAIGIFYCENVGSGTHAVTFTNPGTTPWQNCELHEFTNMAISSSLDKTANTGPTAGLTTRDSGTTAATTQATELVVASVLINNTFGAVSPSDPPSGYTSSDKQDPFNNQSMETAWKEISATGTQVASWTWTGSKTANGIIATFKQLVASPTYTSFQQGRASMLVGGSGSMLATNPLSRREAFLILARLRDAKTHPIDGLIGIASSPIVPATVDWTEAGDTNDVEGANVVGGTLTSTEGADTNAIAGSATVGAAIDATEAGDVNDIEGITADIATVALAEARDVNAIAGITTVGADLASTEGADTSATAGITTVGAALASTEGADTNALDGVTTVSADLPILEGADASSAEAFGQNNADVSWTEGGDSSLTAGAGVEISQSVRGSKVEYLYRDEDFSQQDDEDVMDLTRIFLELAA